MLSWSQQHPEISAMLLLVFGFLLAGVLSYLTGRLVNWMERTLDHYAPTTVTALARLSRFLQRFVYYTTLAVFIIAALRILSLDELGDMLDKLILLLPGFVAAAVILITGYLASIAVYHLLIGALAEQYSRLPARIAQATIIVATILTALAQLSIDVSLIGQVLIVVLLVSLGSLAVAFAIGSRDYVSNLLARRSLQIYSPGDRVRIGEIEGSIIEIGDFGVLIQTDEGIASVPHSTFATSIVTRLTS